MPRPEVYSFGQRVMTVFVRSTGDAIAERAIIPGSARPTTAGLGVLLTVITCWPKAYIRGVLARSLGEDDEAIDDESVFYPAAPALAPCLDPLHHPLNERLLMTHRRLYPEDQIP